MSELTTLIRYYHFMAGVLSHQQSDPLCGNCKAFANTAGRMNESILELEILHAEELRTLQTKFLRMLEESREKIRMIKHPVDAVGQKKTGNCMMPKGVCFIKLPKMIMDKL